MADGQRVAYQVAGNGPPVVHVHGPFFGRSDFMCVTPLLETDFSVVDFDLSGFGATGGQPDHCSLGCWVDDLRDVVDRLGAASVHLHAFSTGAMVAIAFAAAHPGRVGALALTSPIARHDVATRMHNRVRRAVVDSYGSGDELTDLLAIQLLSRSFVDSRGAEAITLLRSLVGRHPSGAIDRAFEEADVVPLLARVGIPTLVIGGTRDVYTPLVLGPSGCGSAAIADRMTDAALHVVESGHLILLERPGEVAELLREFLATAEPARSG